MWAIHGQMACSFGDISTTSFFQQNLLDVMEMEEQYLQIRMNGQIGSEVWLCMEKAGTINMITFG